MEGLYLAEGCFYFSLFPQDQPRKTRGGEEVPLCSVKFEDSGNKPFCRSCIDKLVCKVSGGLQGSNFRCKNGNGSN